MLYIYTYIIYNSNTNNDIHIHIYIYIYTHTRSYIYNIQLPQAVDRARQPSFRGAASFHTTQHRQLIA